MSETPTTPQPGQWQPTNPPAPPVKKKGFVMRHPILAVGVGLVSLFGFQAAFGGGKEAPSTAEPTTASSSATPAAAAKPKVDPDDIGNEANPVTIVEGKAFDVRKFSYAAGWTIKDSDFGMEVANLKVTNNRGKRDSALVQLSFMKGTEVLAAVDCTTDPILEGQTVTVSCLGTDPKPKGYDRLTIHDMF